MSDKLCACGCGTPIVNRDVIYVDKGHSRRAWNWRNYDMIQARKRENYARNPQPTLDRNKSSRQRHADRCRARSEAYRKAHREKYLPYFREYSKKRVAKVRALPPEEQKRYRAKHCQLAKNYYHRNKERILPAKRIYQRQWAAKNKERIRANMARRRAEDICYIIKVRLRTRLRRAMSGFCGRKTISKLVGCSWPELKQHIEKQFKDGMTWENRGTWHIDHIKPVALFDFSDPDQQHVCFHYTNLQPLWALENIRKGRKYDSPAPT